MQGAIQKIYDDEPNKIEEISTTKFFFKKKNNDPITIQSNEGAQVIYVKKEVTL